MTRDDILKTFRQQFGRQPDLLIQAPGRINLIGEHTDYNDGFVLPGAVDYYTWFAFAGNGTGHCRLLAANLSESEEVDLRHLRPGSRVWANYLKGIMEQLQKAGAGIQGIDCVFGGNLPIGSGMSSSAALECGFAYGLDQMLGLSMERPGLAKLAQRSSHEFMGIPCGIMDQFASLMGRAGHLIRLDCRSLAYDYIPARLPGYSLVLLNTRVHHQLANSAYSQRVKECSQGVTILQQWHPEVQSLRDVTVEMLADHRADLDPIVYRRCRYVVEENERLLQTTVLLEKGDVEGIGKLLFRTHEGLRREYEVSCSELDLLVDFAAGYSGVAGARVMGGGFGGCTINLIKEEKATDFVEAALEHYQEQAHIEGEYYRVELVGGVSRVE